MNGVQGVEGSNPFIPTRKQKPQGIYGNVDPFSVFGICPFPLSGVLACRSFREAGPHGTSLPRRPPDHGWYRPWPTWQTADSPSSTSKKATKVSSVAFFVCAKKSGTGKQPPCSQQLRCPLCPQEQKLLGTALAFHFAYPAANFFGYFVYIKNDLVR